MKRSMLIPMLMSVSAMVGQPSEQEVRTAMRSGQWENAIFIASNISDKRIKKDLLLEIARTAPIEVINKHARVIAFDDNETRGLRQSAREEIDAVMKTRIMAHISPDKIQLAEELKQKGEEVMRAREEAGLVE